MGSNAPSTVAPGSPWLGTLATVTLPSPVNSLSALDCVTSQHCWAVGSTVGAGGEPNGATVIATADGGATWTVQPIPATVGYLSGISCSDRRHCTAVGQTSQTANGQGAVITTANGGATWNTATLPAGILDVTAVTLPAQPAVLGHRDDRCRHRRPGDLGRPPRLGAGRHPASHTDRRHQRLLPRCPTLLGDRPCGRRRRPCGRPGGRDHQRWGHLGHHRCPLRSGLPQRHRVRPGDGSAPDPSHRPRRPRVRSRCPAPSLRRPPLPPARPRTTAAGGCAGGVVRSGGHQRRQPSPEPAPGTVSS